MSRIGKLPISIPNGTTIEVKMPIVKIKGPKGELKITIHPALSVEITDNKVLVKRSSEDKFTRSVHGTTRTLMNNMFMGVTKGFEKKLEIQGVGYRATLQGKKLELNLGFSHPIEYTPPEGISITIDQEKKNILTIAGSDKQVVGEVAAKIRSLKKPEPYKGKGIRYLNEVIQRKAGKTAATAKAS